MKYLCLVYNEEEKQGAAPGEVSAYVEELRRKGHFVAAHALSPGQAAAIVRVRSGRLLATEGPAADAERHLSGLLLIDARDLNEAIRLASKMPEARTGSIEIRLVADPDFAAQRPRAVGERPGPE